MTKEEIKEIFIEEATEIIEKLDIDIINLEETLKIKIYSMNCFVVYIP